MASFNELMQQYVNEDYDTLVSFAKRAVAELLPSFKKVDPDHEGFLMLTSFLLAAMGADGKLTALEQKMLKDIFDFDDATIDKLIGMYSSKMEDLVDAFVDNMPKDEAAHALMLVCALASVDEKISREETAFIRKLFA